MLLSRCLTNKLVIRATLKAKVPKILHLISEDLRKRRKIAETTCQLKQIWYFQEILHRKLIYQNVKMNKFKNIAKIILNYSRIL